MCALRRTLPRDGSSRDGERCHRWQQVQSREQPGQELHTGKGGTAACSAGGERRALSEPTGYGRSTGAKRGTGREGDEVDRETDEAERGNGQACRLREADACFA